MEVRILRSSRRTLSVQITPEGEILVRAPRRMKEADIRRFLQEKSQWIGEHLKKAADSQLEARAAGMLTAEEMTLLAAQAKQTLSERTAHFAAILGVSYGTVSVRWQKTRWGSCSAKGNLNYNCLLMLAPPRVQEYVVVHELCHRLEMNHSARFWAEVERILPDYRERRTWLREHGAALMARVPRQ